MSTKFKSLNDFIRNASESKKQRVFEKVIHEALTEQRKLLAKADAMRKEDLCYGNHKS